MDAADGAGLSPLRLFTLGALVSLSRDTAVCLSDGAVVLVRTGAGRHAAGRAREVAARRGRG
eukprot:COSAG02_NODE_1844_length_10683_cov_622.961357_7_plen_62_part_00